MTMISKTNRGIYSDVIKRIVREEIDRLGPGADLNHIDVSNAPDLSDLFYGSDFNGDISKWDVSNVTRMNSMFLFAKSFEHYPESWVVPENGANDMFLGTKVEKLASQKSLKTRSVKPSEQ